MTEKEIANLRGSAEFGDFGTDGEVILRVLEEREKLLTAAKKLGEKVGDGYDTQNHLYPELDHLNDAVQFAESAR